jgi:hypothetical protein
MAAESLKHVRTAFSMTHPIQRFAVLLGAGIIAGGIYYVNAENSVLITFSFFGNKFSSTNIGVAMIAIGAILLIYICRIVIKTAGHLDSVGGTGGSAEVIGDGEAYGGSGGNSGSFGPGGNGGNASVRGSGKAKGGTGGNGK